LLIVVDRLTWEIQYAYGTVKDTLENKQLRTVAKKSRIESIHHRLSQHLIVDIGFINAEVGPLLRFD